MSKQPLNRTYWKRNRPLPYYDQNCRTPRYWKFTQDHRTTRPPLGSSVETGTHNITFEMLIQIL